MDRHSYLLAFILITLYVYLPYTHYHTMEKVNEINKVMNIIKNELYTGVLVKNSCCLNGTSMIGLTWDMSVVDNTSRQCSSQEECLNDICDINDIPTVSWIAIRVTANQNCKK